MSDNFKTLLKRGEVGKVLTAILKDVNGAVTLTGKTVTITARKSITATAAISAAACIVAPDQVANKGQVTYAFDSTTANIAKGEYLLEFKVTGGGNTDFFPLKESDTRQYGKLLVQESL